MKQSVCLGMLLCCTVSTVMGARSHSSPELAIMPRTAKAPLSTTTVRVILAGLSDDGAPREARVGSQFVALVDQKPKTPASALGVDAIARATTAMAAAPPHPVDYVQDIHPLLQANCGGCHLNGNALGGLQLDTREKTLKGGNGGPVVVVGDSAKSRLIDLVQSHDPSKMMPMGSKPLSAAQIGLLRGWIDAGLSYGGMVAAPTGGSSYHSPLAPRQPQLPPGPAGANPIDRILVSYMTAHSVKVRPPVDDRIYMRRVYLDIIGLLPSPGELDSFVEDKRPDKRSLLVDRLLGDNRQYAEHWMSFWNDALRNDYVGTGYIDGGRKQITRWLYHALYTNEPYDKFVSELINPTPDSEGFINGIVWRGTVNASQTTSMQAAQNLSQVFLGINLKCASCHDSFISDWKLTDSYGLAGVFADKPLEIIRCDKPTGRIAPLKFLYPELGSINAQASRPERLAQLAHLLTEPENGRLTRTIVNRLWARLMGRGLVEPVDEMDNRPWNPDLLDWLASDLANNGYDLKKTIKRIVMSRAYGMTASPAPALPGDHYVFAGPWVRRMSAEQFVDAVSSLTGAWPSTQAAKIDSEAKPDSGANGSLLARWVWSDPKAASGTAGGRIYLRKVVDLPELPATASAVASCDNEYTLFVNGKRAGGGDDWQKPQAIDLLPYLVKGKNVFAVEAINWPDVEGGKGLGTAAPNPAGFFLDVRFHASKGPGAVPAAGNAVPAAPASNWEWGTDGSWLCSPPRMPGWETPAFEPAGWKPASELGDASVAPWNLGGLLAATFPTPGQTGGVRAVLVTADPLTLAMGRPNREQVVTSRSSAATTLQGLELTNGHTLAVMLQKGAQQWLATPSPSTADLIGRIYKRALLRAPTSQELQACESLVGAPPQQAGVEDLIWSLTMLPEFQLIY